MMSSIGHAARRGSALLILAFGGLSLLVQQPALAQDSPLDVALAEYQVVPRERVFDAVVEAVHRSTVSAQTSGRITEVTVDVDDFVSKGDIILRFRDREQRANLAAAKAALGEAQARLVEAEAEYERVKNVYERQLVAKAVFDRAEADLQAARQRLSAARAGVQTAEEQVENTVVRAPFAGIVVERHIEVGEAANVGQPLMTGISLEALRATANVSQDVVNIVRATRLARVMLPAIDSTAMRSVEGSNVTVSPYADPTSHTFSVRVDLPEALEGVYPGMFAKVAFVIGQDRRLVVPAEAVVRRSEVTGVYVVRDDGSVALRHVRIGRDVGDGNIEVLAGLTEGEQVALDPIRAGAYLFERRAGSAS